MLAFHFMETLKRSLRSVGLRRREIGGKDLRGAAVEAGGLREKSL